VAELPSGFLSHFVPLLMIDVIMRQHFMTEVTVTVTGKVHPITGHEGPDVE
jgi:hypothetical protein